MANSVLKAVRVVWEMENKGFNNLVNEYGYIIGVDTLEGMKAYFDRCNFLEQPFIECDVNMVKSALKLILKIKENEMREIEGN